MKIRGYEALAKEIKWDDYVEKAWNKNAASWDARSVNMWDNGSRKEIVPFMEKYIDKGSSVIDIGCGSGYGTYKLHEAGYEATGIDISHKMIELAKEQFSVDKLTYVSCNINELVERKKKYDAVLAINVLEWTEDPLEAIENLHEVTKPGGYLCAGILGPTAGPRQNSFPRLLGEQVIFNTMMPWEFAKLAEKSGFTLVDEYGVYKKGITDDITVLLSTELKQALSFMWIFMLQKKD